MRRTDVHDKKTRSFNMSRVRCKDTVAEKKVRSALHAAGYRFRLHRKDLPGSPDIVLPKDRKAIFVHGCFWHRHKDCKRSSFPKSNQLFWQKKFKANITRDLNACSALEALGWRVKIIWECQTFKKEELSIIINNILTN